MSYLQSSNKHHQDGDEAPWIWRSYFEIVRACCCIYLAVSIPLRLAFVSDFSINSKDHLLFVLFDSMSTVFYTFEIILIFCMSQHSNRCSVVPSETTQLILAKTKKRRTGFTVLSTARDRNNRIREQQNGSSSSFLMKVTSRQLSDYMIHWDILVSFLATVPLEYVTIFTTAKRANFYMLNRAFRILFLPSYLTDISSILEEQNIITNIGIQRTWKFFFAMALAGHWCGCIFFLVAKGQALSYGSTMTWPQNIGIFQVVTTTNITDSSISVHKLQWLQNGPQAYIQTLYWAYITMITTGFGDIVPLSTQETLWCIISMYIGLLITACSIANLQLLVTNMDAALTAFQHKMELLKYYMQYRKLSNHLQNRITSFYDYQWDLLKGVDEEQILKELPRSLQQQIANFLYRDLIRSLPVLRKANNALLSALTDCSEVNIYSPNDEILRPGELLRGALMVSQGEVEILDKRNRVQQKMQQFDRYAEESLFEPRESQHLVRSKTFSEVFLLPTADFQKIITSQCEKSHIAQMKETALVQASIGTSKANKMFGSAENTTPTKGFQKHCHPGSTFRNVWDCTMVLGLIYYIFSIPLSMMKCLETTSFHHYADSTLLIVGYMVDLLFLVDIIFNYNYFMFIKEGLVQHNKERIRDNFFQKYNIPKEIFSAIPFEVLSLVFGNKYLHFYRLPKVARLLKTFKYVARAERLVEDMNSLGMDQSLRRVIKLNFLMIVVCHWVGCFWYLSAEISKYIKLESNWREEDETNISLAISHSDLGGFSGYLRSVYWAIVGMSTVGYGDIVPTNMLETTVATIVILFGGLVLPAVVGGLAAYMGNLNFAIKEYRKKTTRIFGYMRRTNIEKKVVDRVCHYYDYLWSCQGGVNEQNVMDELSGPLWDRVAMHVNGEDIKVIPFFNSCDERTKNLLVALLKPRVFLPGDQISSEKEIGKEMYLIERGAVMVFSEHPEKIPLNILTKGDYFGESCLLSGAARVANVKALTYCDCFVLTKDDFLDVMEEIQELHREEIIQSIKDTLRKKCQANKNIIKNITEYPKCEDRTKGLDLLKNGAELHVGRSIFLPNSVFRQIWNCIITVIIVYNAWAIPFRLSFPYSTSTYIIDWCFDGFFAIDIFLKLFEFSYVYQGALISDRNMIKRHYLQGNFKADFVASVPFDILALLIPRNINDDASSTSLKLIIMAVLRVPKLIRLSQLFELLSEIFRALEESNSFLSPIQLLELLTGVILIAHWAGCGFHAFARWKNDQGLCEQYPDDEIILSWGNERGECLWGDTWIQKQIENGKLPINGGDTWQLYIRSFNWALPTLVVVVIGDVVPITSEETLYAFLWMVVGVTINATIIGSVANLVANLETESAEFLKKADAIKYWMYKHKVEQSLQDRVEHFMDYIFKAHQGMINEASFIKDLPISLQSEITEQTRMKYIKECPYFYFCSDEIVTALTLCLKPVIFSVGDIFIHAGEMGHEMFFLDKGSVEVISADRKTVYATLTEGSFFGETALFFKQKRNSTIRALTFCEVFQLDKEDLDNELRQREFDISRMLDVFVSMSKSNNKRNAAVAANLKKSRVKGSKLNKLIGLETEEISSWKRRLRIFLPNSLFRAVWDIFCTLFSLYFGVIIPYRIAFILDENMMQSFPWLFLDFTFDIFFLVDLILRSSYFGYIRNGVLVTEREKIRKNYKENQMFMDALSCFPLEAICFFNGIKYIFFFRLIHMIRIYRLPYYFSKIDHYLNLWKVRISAASSLLLRMFLFYILVNHWCACMWFVIHRYLEREVQFTWATTDCPGDEGNICLAEWNEELGIHNVCNSSISKCYIRSFYFVITTISTVGYGDISPVTEVETLWENTVILIGACFMAGVIGGFTAFLSQNDDSGSNAFKSKLKQVHQYMKYRKLPRQLRSEIIIYHKHKWKHHQVLDVQTVLGILSAPLRMDLSYAVYKNVIDTTPVLKSYSQIVQKRITNAFKLQMSPAGSNIYMVGDIGWDIYFIGSGLIQISLPSDLTVLDTEGRINAPRVKQKAESIGLLYKRGNHFGESCLQSESGVRQETCTAKTMVELYLISKEDLEDIWMYMGKENRYKMKNDLLVRNGNTWHFFDDDDDNNDCSSMNSSLSSFSEIETSSRGRVNSIEEDEVLQRPPHRPTSVFTGSSPMRTSFTFRHRNATLRSLTPKIKSRGRLRSFSAAASRDAMKRMAKENLSRKGSRKGSTNSINSTGLSSVDEERNVSFINES